MGHDNEYHGAIIAVLELVWGEGFMRRAAWHLSLWAALSL
jgi:hypothetical protein